jgi:hypothetical protein
MQDAMLNVFIFILWEVGFQIIICQQFSTHGFRTNTNDEIEASTFDMEEMNSLPNNKDSNF